MNIKRIRYATDGKMQCKISYDPESEWITLKNSLEGNLVDRPKANVAPLPISKVKYQDLQSMLSVVPVDQRQFYVNLPNVD